MTAEEFAARLEELIEDARQGGLPDQAIIAGLEAGLAGRIGHPGYDTEAVWR